MHGENWKCCNIIPIIQILLIKLSCAPLLGIAKYMGIIKGEHISLYLFLHHTIPVHYTDDTCPWSDKFPDKFYIK